MMSKKKSIIVWTCVWMVPLIIVSVIFIGKKQKEREAKTAEAFLKTYVWPQEEQFITEQVKRRQNTNEAASGVTIDLKSYINTALTDSPASPKGIAKNNLAELPKGVHVFGGVPFDVQ